MEIIADLIDNEFEYNGITHERMISRGVVFDDNFNIALIKLHGRDDLGSRNYYELPGGGVELNESIDDAFIREIGEEIGYNTVILDEIGIVKDYYNVLKRHNINHYFLAKILNETPKKYNDFENKVIERIEFVNIDEAIKIFKKQRNSKLARLVRNRELRVLLIARDLMEKKYGYKSI